MIDVEREKKALRLVEAAAVLAKEADTLHGQPLYYDEEGAPVEIVEVLEQTAFALRQIILDEGGKLNV